MKILMLHGYAQNATTFRLKLRRLEEGILKAHPDTQFVYPNAPIRLRASDVPGCEGLSTNGHEDDSDGLELRAWFQLRYVQDPPCGLSQSLGELARVLQSQVPFDGVVAFSQGTVVAAMVASLLQGESRWDAYVKALGISSSIMAYPEAFLGLRHPPLKFGVLYAGRVGKASYYDWIYKAPRVETPFCHIVGSWDPLVEHDERDAVLEKLQGSGRSVVVVHGGGHFVPTDGRNVDCVVKFVGECIRR